MAETARNQEIVIQNLNRRFNESLTNPSTASDTALAPKIERLEARTVTLQFEKKAEEDRLAKLQKNILSGTRLDEQTVNELRVREKNLSRDLRKAQDELILTQDDLTSTKADLAFHVSALQTMLAKDKEREAEDAEMDDSDNDAHPGVSRARREIDSLKERLRQSEQENYNMADRLDEKTKESKRLESENNKLKSKNTKLEES